MKLTAPAKKMIILIASITAAFIAGGIVLCFALRSLTAADIPPVTLGILLSSAVGCVKVLLLNYQVTKLLSMEDQNKARFFAMGQGLLRFAVTGCGLVAAHFIPFTDLIAAIAGAFIYNIAVYSLRFSKFDEDDNYPKSDENEAANQRNDDDKNYT